MAPALELFRASQPGEGPTETPPGLLASFEAGVKDAQAAPVLHRYCR
jgi:hypothetical protein